MQIGVPVYCICYIIFFLLIRPYIVSRKIGKSPVVITFYTNAAIRANTYFKAAVVILLALLLAGAFLPVPYIHNFLHQKLFTQITALSSNILKLAGLALLIVSFAIVFFAQKQMRDSFRVGIDEATRTDLVSDGMFGYSRNPIYVGMIITMFGLFLIYPNLLMLLLMVIGCILIRLQISLEEGFLFEMHGQQFLEYKKKVRRFI